VDADEEQILRELRQVVYRELVQEGRCHELLAQLTKGGIG